ncbi:MAG: hypothetical protein ACYC2E_03015 [Sulfuricella sp.]
MAFGGALDFLGGIMGDFLDILMTVRTLYPDVRTFVKNSLVDVKQPEFTIFIYAAQASILVAEKAVQFILGVGRPCYAAEQQCREERNDVRFEE